mmetsp:Transcript_32064/g.54712  ORF Transcript_32064/g.54712 Transcript_32064/m.54712 type:complete len:239 (-) Transcript_32064:439-1155(-)
MIAPISQEFVHHIAHDALHGHFLPFQKVIQLTLVGMFPPNCIDLVDALFSLGQIRSPNVFADPSVNKERIHIRGQMHNGTLFHPIAEIRSRSKSIQIGINVLLQSFFGELPMLWGNEVSDCVHDTALLMHCRLLRQGGHESHGRVGHVGVDFHASFVEKIEDQIVPVIEITGHGWMNCFTNAAARLLRVAPVFFIFRLFVFVSFGIIEIIVIFPRMNRRIGVRAVPFHRRDPRIPIAQ